MSAALVTVIKYGFLGLVVTGAGFLIANTAVMMKHKGAEEFVYRAHVMPSAAPAPLDKNFMRCLTHPRRAFCLMTPARRKRLLNNRHNETKSPGEENPGSTFSFLQQFVNLTRGGAMVLLDPSVLFCMLRPLQKYDLISSGFDTNVLRGDTDDVITFGVFNSTIMDTFRTQALEAGFVVSEDLDTDLMATQYFYSKDNGTAHVLVLFQKEGFLWHPGHSLADLPVQDGPLSRNSIYENFTSVPLPDQHLGIRYPSQPVNFLRQIQNSVFEECQMPSSPDVVPQQHPALTNEQLKHRLQIAIKELKAKLQGIMGYFWMWKDTLAEWREHCDLFHKTAEFSIAVRAATLSRLNLNDSDDQYLRLVQVGQWEDVLHKVSVDCHGLMIHIFAVYEDFDSIWHYEDDHRKIIHSKFQLCSTSVVGQLVHKPCEDSFA